MLYNLTSISRNGRHVSRQSPGEVIRCNLSLDNLPSFSLSLSLSLPLSLSPSLSLSLSLSLFLFLFLSISSAADVSTNITGKFQKLYATICASGK